MCLVVSVGGKFSTRTEWALVVMGASVPCLFLDVSFQSNEAFALLPTADTFMLFAVVGLFVQKNSLCTLEVLLTNITERRVSIVHFTMFLELFLGLEDDLAMAVTAGKLSLLQRLVGIQVY